VIAVLVGDDARLERARALAGEGATVVVCLPPGSAGEGLVAAVEADGRGRVALFCLEGNRGNGADEWRHAVDLAVEQFGRVDIVEGAPWPA